MSAGSLPSYPEPMSNADVLLEIGGALFWVLIVLGIVYFLVLDGIEWHREGKERVRRYNAACRRWEEQQASEAIREAQHRVAVGQDPMPQDAVDRTCEQILRAEGLR